MTRNFRTLLALLLTAPSGLICLLQVLPFIPLSVAEMARFLPYFWILPFNVLALTLTWRLNWWVIGLSLAALLCQLFIAMGLKANFNMLSDKPGHTLRVMTYNTKVYQARHKPDGLLQLADEIGLQRADVIALQDADGWIQNVPDSVPKRMPQFLGYPEVFAVGQYIIASRYPIANCTSALLGNYQRAKNYLRCQLVVNDKTLTLVTAHLISPRNSILSARSDPMDGATGWEENFQERLNESQKLTSDLAAIEGPLLVMGDFNAREESPVLAPFLESGLQDAFSSAGNGTGFTYGHAVHRHIDFLRIDHILTSSELTVRDIRVGSAHPSDHNPVIATLVFQPTN